MIGPSGKRWDRRVKRRVSPRGRKRRTETNGRARCPSCRREEGVIRDKGRNTGGSNIAPLLKTRVWASQDGPGVHKIVEGVKRVDEEENYPKVRGGNKGHTRMPLRITSRRHFTAPPSFKTTCAINVHHHLRAGRVSRVYEN